MLEIILNSKEFHLPRHEYDELLRNRGVHPTSPRSIQFDPYRRTYTIKQDLRDVPEEHYAQLAMLAMKQEI